MVRQGNEEGPTEAYVCKSQGGPDEGDDGSPFILFAFWDLKSWRRVDARRSG